MHISNISAQTEGRTPVRSWPTIVLLYIAVLVTLGPSVRLSQWHIAPENNQAAAEAMAWLNGHLNITGGRGGDMAIYQDRVYNVFPPLLTIICYIAFGLHRELVGEPIVFFDLLYALLIAAPIPLLFFAAFRRVVSDTRWAALLAYYAIAGTSLWPVAAFIKNGWIYSIQHVLSQIGLAILLIDLLGRRRYWLGGIGVLIAAWSRQACGLYALSLLWCAWREPNRSRAMLRAAIPLIIAVGVPAALNHAKFGSPTETGYAYIFEGREGEINDSMGGPDGKLRIFAARYIPDHAYHKFFALPWFDWSIDGLTISGPANGTAVWFTTPMLLLLVFGVRHWWQHPARRALIFGTVPVILLNCAYHGPLDGNPGFCRYSLDFLLVWLVCIAPATESRRGRAWALACLAWSVSYFYMVTPTTGF